VEAIKGERHEKGVFYFLYDFCVGIQHDSLMASYTILGFLRPTPGRVEPEGTKIVCSE
jgi:hypothetical protein